MSQVVVVVKRTLYAQHVEDRRDPEVLRLLAAQDPSVARWKQAHDDHEHTVTAVTEALRAAAVSFTIFHGAHAEFNAENAELVVTVGGDGTLLGASHHVGRVPIIGVNSAPQHSVGFFCAARAENFAAMLEQALKGAIRQVTLSRMEVSVGTRVCSRRVLNEALFSHAIPAATSRYIVEYKGEDEEQRSSGLWVGTAAGSTGAIRAAGGELLAFSSRKLQLVVREPYRGEESNYRFGKLIVLEGESLQVKSKMQDAELFLDGPYARFKVGLGDVVQFRVSDEPLKLLGFELRRDDADVVE